MATPFCIVKRPSRTRNPSNRHENSVHIAMQYTFQLNFMEFLLGCIAHVLQRTIETGRVISRLPKRPTRGKPVVEKAGAAPRRGRRRRMRPAIADDADAKPEREKWCLGVESNHRHADFQSAALPLSYPGGRFQEGRL